MLEETVRQKLIVLIDNGNTTNTGILMSIRPPVPEECRKKALQMFISFEDSKTPQFLFEKGCKSPKSTRSKAEQSHQSTEYNDIVMPRDSEAFP